MELTLRCLLEAMEHDEMCEDESDEVGLHDKLHDKLHELSAKAFEVLSVIKDDPRLNAEAIGEQLYFLTGL